MPKTKGVVTLFVEYVLPIRLTEYLSLVYTTLIKCGKLYPNQYQGAMPILIEKKPNREIGWIFRNDSCIINVNNTKRK
ncbi:hypothetical protein GCM10025860_16970 [Methanobacterium ferruginis]|nr:hypothetical protein GCM10025860_16970 [Methanobacterium ferruginis]